MHDHAIRRWRPVDEWLTRADDDPHVPDYARPVQLPTPSRRKRGPVPGTTPPKTSCPAGHDLTVASNIYTYSGSRSCRTCRNQRAAAYQATRRART